MDYVNAVQAVAYPTSPRILNPQDIRPPDANATDRVTIPPMSTAAAPRDPIHDAAILATIERHRAMLGEMAEIALELARWLKDQVMGGLFKGRNPVAQLELLGRVLRQILAMDELIAQDPLGIVKLFNKMLGRRESAERKEVSQERGAPAEPPAPAPPAPPGDTPKPPRAENLLGDLFDPLFQLRDKPIGDVIAGICRDIGVDPDRYQWDLAPEPEPEPAAAPVKPKATAKTSRLFGSTAISPPTHLNLSFSPLKGGEGTHGTRRGPPLRP